MSGRMFLQIKYRKSLYAVTCTLLQEQYCCTVTPSIICMITHLTGNICLYLFTKKLLHILSSSVWPWGHQVNSQPCSVRCWSLWQCIFPLIKIKGISEKVPSAPENVRLTQDQTLTSRSPTTPLNTVANLNPLLKINTEVPSKVNEHETHNGPEEKWMDWGTPC